MTEAVVGSCGVRAVRDPRMRPARRPRDPRTYGRAMSRSPLHDDPGVRWLLERADPSVVYRVSTEVLGRSGTATAMRETRRAIPDGPKVRALLAGQDETGGFGVQKWTGAFWRLISLVELAVPPGEPRAVAAFEHVLAWLVPRVTKVDVVAGRVRRCASQEGYAVAVACRLGLARDPRIRTMARSLIEWQWPDGGWNCDKRPQVSHSSFHETLGSLWGLAEYAGATGDTDAEAAAARAAEFYLAHQLYRSHRKEEVLHPALLRMRWPSYWHYDILRGLTILHRAGRLGDTRTHAALDVVESKRREDGTWSADGRWWRRVGGSATYSEAVDWGISGPNEMITLDALQILGAAGRL